MVRLALAFLGPFRANFDSIPVRGFESDKVRALLAYMAMQAGQPHRRDSLAALLWPEQPQEVALKNLRHVLYKLRQVLGDGEGEKGDRRDGRPYVLVSTQSAEFNSDADFGLDVTEFTHLIDTCRAHRHRRIDICGSCHVRLVEATALYRGDFLAGFSLADSIEFEEWMLVQREALHRQAVYALTHLAAYSEARGDYLAAASYARKQLELEPWNEEAHRHLMRLLWLTGQRTAALAQYQACCLVLSEELDIKPGAQTEALYCRILESKGDGPDEGSDELLDARSRHNLPVDMTPFVGREEDLSRIAERMESPERRLITLLGPGGIGKSRLALAAAANQIGAFEDGVYFVPMAPVAGSNLIVSAIAQALSLQFSGNVDEESQLLRYLADKEMLLVMDNFEHLLKGTNILLGIIESAPGVSLLVTSRERLNLQAESVLEVGGLGYPSAGVSEDLDSTAVERVMSYEAVRLFLERTRARDKAYQLTSRALAAIVKICRVVGGLPLAIELAAVQVGDFTCEEIAEAIQANLDFLATNQGDISPMHSSIRAVFNYSWDLLSDDEQRVFRNLSVFRGGWSSEAAEQVAGASRRQLGTLVSKSLITRSTSDAGVRYDIHEVLRQYAAEQLEVLPAEKTEVMERHTEHYLALAESAEPHLRGADQEVWLGRLEQEHANLQAAIRWTAESGYSETGLRLGGALWQFWVMHAHYATGRELLSNFDLQGAECTPAWAKALFGAGRLAMQQGDHVGTRQFMEQSLELYRRLGDDAAVRQVTIEIARSCLRQGVFHRAEELATQALQMARTAGDLPVMTSALTHLGHAAANQNNYAKARQLYTECLAIQRGMEDKWGIAWTLTNLGNLTHRDGDTEAGRLLLEESISIRRQLGDKWGIAASITSLGTFAAEEGKFDEARCYLEQGLALRREIGDAWAIAESFIYLGYLDYSEGKFEQALDKWGWCLTQTYEQQNHFFMAYCFAGLAATAMKMGRIKKAVIIAGAVGTLLGSLGVHLSPEFRRLYDEVMAMGQSELGDEDWTPAWAVGTGMTLDAAYEEASALRC